MLVQSKIISILNEVLNQTARLRKGATQATYHCPFCLDKNPITQKLEIAIDGPHVGNYHCWRCDAKGRSLGSFLTRIKAPKKYREQLHAITGDIRLTRRVKPKSDSELALPDEFHPLAVIVDSPEYKNALYYVKRRKLTDEDIVRYNIGYCESGPYEGHVIVPSYDADGKLNFFIGRRYYKLDKGIPYKKPDVPMNVVGFESFINYNEPIILVEGPFNAITIRKNVIPMFGKYPSRKLYESMIVNKIKVVYVCLDTDASKDSLKICERLLRLNVTPYMVELQGGKDPNELGYEKSWKYINNAKEADFSFLLKKKMGM